MFKLLLNEKIYQDFVRLEIIKANKFVWFVTADIKDMYIDINGNFMPLIEMIAELVKKGIMIRLIHAKEPGSRFRQDFDRFENLLNSDLFERILCPRVHTKAIIIDGKIAFTGSANMTGAGLGAKGKNKRNFEAGFMFDEIQAITELMEWVDNLYLGNYCLQCQRRDICPDPII